MVLLAAGVSGSATFRSMAPFFMLKARKSSCACVTSFSAAIGARQSRFQTIVQLPRTVTHCCHGRLH
jgi:hypothetical protein